MSPRCPWSWHYGLVFGVLAREGGLSVITAIAISATVLAGAAQLITVGLWDWPIPVVAIVGTTLVVNLRYLLMGASLRPWFTRLSSRQAYMSLFFIADENWALTIKDLRAGNERGRFFWVVGWQSGPSGLLLPLSVQSQVVASVTRRPTGWISS